MKKTTVLLTEEQAKHVKGQASSHFRGNKTRYWQALIENDMAREKLNWPIDAYRLIWEVGPAQLEAFRLMSKFRFSGKNQKIT